jgi:preprotein translocase subunit YajC
MNFNEASVECDKSNLLIDHLTTVLMVVFFLLGFYVFYKPKPKRNETERKQINSHPRLDNEDEAFFMEN